MEPDDDKLRWVISRSKRAVLTTIDAYGYPHSVEMDLLGTDGDHILYFSTPSSARKVTNIRDNGKAGVCSPTVGTAYLSLAMRRSSMTGT